MKAASASAGKVIVFTPGVTAKLCVTAVAAAKFVFPSWLAVIEQVPAETNPIVPPVVTEQTVPVVVE